MEIILTPNIVLQIREVCLMGLYFMMIRYMSYWGVLQTHTYVSIAKNYTLIVMVDTQKDKLYNYRFMKPSNPYFLFKDPFTDR